MSSGPAGCEPCLGARQTELPSGLTTIPLRLGDDNVMHGPPICRKDGVVRCNTESWAMYHPAMRKTYHRWMALATNFGKF